MDICDTIDAMRTRSDQLHLAGKTIGFVPTMGYLHEGHLSLMRIARERADTLITSIYVNPAQFAPHEDFTTYPRDMERDLAMLEDIGCDTVFTPGDAMMYPPNYRTWLDIEGMMAPLCGITRPIFFRGVATVVCKLFNIVRPHLAVFGQKDAQQALVIKRMVADLDMGIDIVVGPIIREPDGLAVSSRNVYLTPDQRRHAPVLHQSLQLAKDLLLQPKPSKEDILNQMRALIESKPGADIDYIEMVHGETLQLLEELKGPILLALAVKFGHTRLIDNITLDL